MPWFVYLLLCDENTFYVGITDDVKSSFLAHRNKQSFYTEKFSLLKLVYCEKYPNKYEAAKREQQFKRWSHAKKQMLVDRKLGMSAYTDLAKDLVRELEN